MSGGKWRNLFSSLVISLLLFSCKTESGFIPSYVRIDSVGVNANSIFGNNLEDFQAIQVYQNGQTVGTFPIPCTFPVDGEGRTKLNIVPYIKNNGNSNTLIPYRTIQPLDIEVELIREKAVVSYPIFNFRPNTKVVWQEDFESGNSTLVPIRIHNGDSVSVKSDSFSLLGRYFTNNNKFHNTYIFENDSLKSIDLAIFDRIKFLPADGREVFVEFDVKSDVPVTLALKRFTPDKSQFGKFIESYVPYMTANPTKGQWKRFYSNLIYEIQGQPSGTEYLILFSFDKPAEYSGDLNVKIDNIRVTFLE
jgi:hypothetical protein